MSDTPRTDEQAIRIMFGNLDTIVPVEFARQLETELAEAQERINEYESQEYFDSSLIKAREQLVEARAEIERKNRLIEQMRVALKLALLFIPENAVDAIRLSKAALSAAERMSK